MKSPMLRICLLQFWALQVGLELHDVTQVLLWFLLRDMHSKFPSRQMQNELRAWLVKQCNSKCCCVRAEAKWLAVPLLLRVLGHR